MIGKVDSFKRVSAVALALLGVALLWLLLTKGLPTYLATDSPRAALALRSSQPLALLNLAETQLNPRVRETGEDTSDADARQTPGEPGTAGADRLGGWAEIALKALTRQLPGGTSGAAAIAQLNLSQKDRDSIRVEAQRALREDPLNARALRILGQLADMDGNKAEAAKLMRAAVDRSSGESLALYWMLQKSAAEKDYTNTIRYADVLLRKRPQLADVVAPALAQVAESSDARAVAEFEALLAGNPPWRSVFLYALLKRVTDARTPLYLLLSVKDTPTPPTAVELGQYLTFLISHQLYELAYYTWLQFLPADELAKVGLLTNGNFETAPSGLPFDWVIQTGAGSSMEVTARPDAPGKHALFVELGPGRVEFPGVTQLLLLTPGSYHIKGQVKGELDGRRGLQWRVTCAQGAPLSEGPMFVGEAPEWTNFEFDFTVPNKDCRAQYLRLDLAARSASEQLVSGSVWYDNLQLTRLGQSASGN